MLQRIPLLGLHQPVLTTARVARSSKVSHRAGRVCHHRNHAKWRSRIASAPSYETNLLNAPRVLPARWQGGAIHGAGTGRRIASCKSSLLMVQPASLSGGEAPLPLLSTAAASRRLLTTRTARCMKLTASGCTPCSPCCFASSIIRSCSAFNWQCEKRATRSVSTPPGNTWGLSHNISRSSEGTAAMRRVCDRDSNAPAPPPEDQPRDRAVAQWQTHRG